MTAALGRADWPGAVMISHQHRCIFIHIPKCAGTSIETALGHFVGHEGRGGQDHRSIRMLQCPRVPLSALTCRDSLEEVARWFLHQYVRKADNGKNREVVSAAQFSDYFKFTVVRNPWARAVSWYKNVMRDDVHLQSYGISADTSFRDFLCAHAGKAALRPQLQWLTAFDGSVPLDAIVRFENLAADMEPVFASLGLSGTSLPHRIAGKADDYRTYYDAETDAVIRAVYRSDIDYFGYSFDGIIQRPGSVPESRNADLA